MFLRIYVPWNLIEDGWFWCQDTCSQYELLLWIPDSSGHKSRCQTENGMLIFNLIWETRTRCNKTEKTVWSLELCKPDKMSKSKMPLNNFERSLNNNSYWVWDWHLVCVTVPNILKTNGWKYEGNSATAPKS